MTPSEDCYALIRASEGFRAEAYRDPAGLWTIGYGHKITSVPQVTEVWTEDQANLVMQSDALEACEQVQSLVVAMLTQGQLDALTDFVFNLGAERLKESTLLRKLNAGNYADVPAELGRWIYAGGKIQPGLQIRREAEIKLWEKA